MYIYFAGGERMSDMMKMLWSRGFKSDKERTIHTCSIRQKHIPKVVSVRQNGGALTTIKILDENQQ